MSTRKKSSSGEYIFKNITRSTSSNSKYSYRTTTPNPQLPPEIVKTILGMADKPGLTFSKSHNTDYLRKLAISHSSVVKKQTLLLNAANAGNIEYVKFLLSMPGVKNSLIMQVAIDRASEAGHTNIVKLLLEQPKSFSAPKDNALKEAVYHNFKDIVKILSKVSGITNEEYEKSLILASSLGHLSIVKILASIPGVHISYRAMLEATYNGHLEVIKFLCSFPLIRTNIDLIHQCILNACANNMLSIVKFLSRIPAVNMAYYDNSFIRVASEMGHIKIVKYLLQFPRVINLQGGLKHALISASENGHLEVVKLLLTQKGVDVLIQDAIDMALIGRHYKVAEYLESYIRRKK